MSGPELFGSDSECVNHGSILRVMAYIEDQQQKNSYHYQFHAMNASRESQIDSLSGENLDEYERPTPNSGKYLFFNVRNQPRKICVIK